MDSNIILVNQVISLDSVSFQKKENLKGTFRVNATDVFSDLIINEDGISFKYKRHISLEPEALFDVSIVFSYSAKFDQTSSVAMKERNYVLNNEHIEKIINNTTMPQTASLLVSNLTVTNGGNPLITQPHFIKN